MGKCARRGRASESECGRMGECESQNVSDGCASVSRSECVDECERMHRGKCALVGDGEWVCENTDRCMRVCDGVYTHACAHVCAHGCVYMCVCMV